MEVLAWLQRDDVVGWISSQSGIKLRKTPGYDTFNQALCLDLPLATLLKVTFCYQECAQKCAQFSSCPDVFC
jgi:hypothetical protein